MAPQLSTPDGKPLAAAPATAADADEVNRKFEQTMAGTPGDALPKRQEQASAPAEPNRPRTTRRATSGNKNDKKAHTTTVALSDGQRHEGVKGLAQVGAALLLMAGKSTKNDSFLADAVTVNSTADQWADAAVATAQQDARFAAALDRICAAGPYAALISVAVGTGTQVARNHKPDLALPGTVHPKELLAALEQSEAQQEPETAGAGAQ